MRKLLGMFRATPGAATQSLYAAIVGQARDKHWYLEGKVPDDMDGRFALLSSLVALTILRLERGGEDAVRASVSLTEGFIADMDAQMREIGFDTTIGKQVRGLVGALAARVDRWRRATDGTDEEWTAATRFSVYRDAPDMDESTLTYAAEQMRRFAERIDGEPDAKLLRGEL
ncbi:ubiquinol-cytochrome C chaperone family protein [Sphingomicrobium sp. XHP0239]|uniref:ubiquinol-cytochrome C chaperone family protein n=1 Tax=Sphingomicrobium maritimum TaxID=3133972 RepID=UPI0031CCA823